MAKDEAIAKWCAEARRILTLAAKDRAAPKEALSKALLAKHGALADKIAALPTLLKMAPSVAEPKAQAALTHDLGIARSQINIEEFALAAESLKEIADKIEALVLAGKAEAKAGVLRESDASDQTRKDLKGAMGLALAEARGAAPSAETLETLRKMAEAEFKRDADQAALLKAAGTLDLGLPPPPARTAFEDNTSAAAAVWTADICESAFKTHTWFDFKAFRKLGAKADFKVPGLVGKAEITDDVMWRLYQFRRHVVDGLVAQLNAEFPGKLLFSSNGSEDIESDLDITVASPRAGDDVTAMALFNKRVEARFKRPPGRVFDTNLYARDYNAIKVDNLSKDRAGPVPVDHAIAEPGGQMQKMANIDQDVATLMKQRRFMDGEAFTQMWEGLRDSMPEKDRKALQLRFEEAEDVYLLTAMEKVDAIVTKIKASLAGFNAKAYADLYGPERAAERAEAQREFAEMLARFDGAKKAHEDSAAGSNNTRALLEFQQFQNEFLDFMEANFEDEVMVATDAIYAERMEALRADQFFIQEQEAAIASAQPGDEGLAQMQVALASAKARAKQAQFTNIVFANEAYVSQGAITHVVSGKQAGDASVLAKITPAELMQSSNEQLADFLKDMKHMAHAVPEGDVGDDKGATRRRATGEAFVHASKYLARMLEAVAMLESKYRIQLGGQGPDAEAQLTALTQPYDIVNEAEGLAEKTPKALQTAVEGHLLKLRKSASIPGEVKAELALAEAMKLFGTPDIPALRNKIQAFCTEFNRRVRQLEDFRTSQAVDDGTFKQYFDPSAPSVAPVLTAAR